MVKLPATVQTISEDRRLRRYLVLLSVLSFVLLTAAILTVYANPMGGYEYSIYSSTPLIFWLAIIFGQMAGILLFYTFYGTGSRLWAVGLFQILLTNFILMTLYLYKGFIYLERTDSLSYVGYAKDIVANGQFATSNFYPFASIMMATLGETVGQGMIMMSQLSPAIFFTAYTVGILCWSRTISTKPMFVTSMMLASMPIFFAWFIPTLFNQTLCVLMLPFFFFILWRSMGGDPRYKGLAALFIVFFVIGHPLVAMMVILFLIVVLLNDHITKQKTKSVSLYMVMFSFVLLFGWIVFHALLVSDLRNILEQLMGFADGTSTFGNASAQASQMGILSTVQSVLVCISDDIMFAVLGLAAGIMILRRGWKTHPMTLVVGLFVVGGAFLVAIVLFTYAHNPFRLINLNFIMIFTVPLAGWVLYTMRDSGRKTLARLIVVIVAVCMVSTVFTVYQDPNTVFPNGSVTRSEIVGSNWLVTEKDSQDFAIYTIQTSPWRYTDLIYGAAYKRVNYDIVDKDLTTTAHFDSFLNSNTSADYTLYLVLSTYEDIAYSKTWVQAGKFNADDFNKLVYRPTVNHVYSSSDIDFYSRSVG